MLARVLKIVAGIAAIAAAGFAVYHFRLWERDWSAIDEGWASLIGSAVGSFLAVVGALYVNKAEERRKKKAFEDFVRVAVQNLVIQASYLEAMAREPHKIAPALSDQHGIVSMQLRNLLDALLVFDREIAHSKDGEYDLRRSIVSLDAMLSESRHHLTSEADIHRALRNWHVGAYQLRYHATSFLESLQWITPTPPVELIVENVQVLTKTWKSWNIPKVSDGSVPPARSSQNQPLHHAHA